MTKYVVLKKANLYSVHNAIFNLNFRFFVFSAVAYADTNDYYWPLLSTHLPELETALEKDETAYTNVDGKVDPLPETRGPFGFGDAIQLNDDKVSCNFQLELIY